MKKVFAAALALAMSLSLAACGGGSNPPAGGSGGAGDSAGPAREDAVIALKNEPTILDPQLAADSIGGMIILNMHDPLVRRDAEGKVVPALAKEWTVSEDGKCITFTLQEGVKFQDGTPLTAEDVAFSLNRAMEKPQSELFTSFMEKAEVVDESTVNLYLHYRELAALQYLTQTNNCIVSKAYVESVGDENYSNAPMGTGPYKFVEWQKGSKIILEANPDYFEGAPAIQRLELRILKEATTSMVALETGDVDMLYDLSAMDKPTVEGNDKLGYQETFGTAIWNIGFNTNMAPFDNVKVRNALAMATNREEIVVGAFDGGASVNETILTPQTAPNPGFDQVATLGYDVEAAKQLLAEAGYPNGFKTKICVREDFTKRIGSILQSQWKQIGVEAEIVVMERAALMADIKAGKVPCYTIGNVSMTMDASFLLGTLTTNNIPDSNYVFYSNPDYDALVEAQANESDEAKRLELVTEALNMEAKDTPRIVLVNPVTNIAYNANLNCQVYPAMESYRWNQMSWN